jgi:diacylglycerol kinase (ATP)
VTALQNKPRTDISAADLADTVFLINPLAGNGRGQETWSMLLAHLPELGNTRLIKSRNPAEALQKLNETLTENVRRLVVIGGDGSLHLAANHVLKNGYTKQVALGLIPAGTGSDYARILRLSGDPLQALHQICTAVPRKVDVLRITDGNGEVRYAINTFSTGVSGWVSRRLAGLAVKGSAVYLRTTLKAFISFEAVDCRVVVDNTPWFEGPLYLLAITKGSHFGQGMHISPRASLDNGLCEVVAVEPMSRWRLPLRLCRLYLGNHLSASYVHYRQGRTVVIEPITNNPGFEIDGESTDAASVTVETVPAALTMLA